MQAPPATCESASSKYRTSVEQLTGQEEWRTKEHGFVWFGCCSFISQCDQRRSHQYLTLILWKRKEKHPAIPILPIWHHPTDKRYLRKKFFVMETVFYQQCRGLAMGNWLKPILAILYMGRVGKTSNLFRSISSISICYRYIDDCIAPVNNPNKAIMIQHHFKSEGRFMCH